MRLQRSIVLGATLAAVGALCGCRGGASAGGAATPLAPSPVATAIGSGPASVTLNFASPKGAASHDRRASFIATSTNAFLLNVDTGAQLVCVNATGPTSVNLTGLGLGSHTFFVQAFSGACTSGTAAGGFATSSATQTATLVAGPNSVAMTLAGIVSNITVVPSLATPALGFVGSINLTVNAYTIAGDLITTGSYANPITLSSSDALHAPLATSSVPAAGVGGQVAFNDDCAGPVTITALATGASGSAAIGTDRYAVTSASDGSGPGTLRAGLTSAANIITAPASTTINMSTGGTFPLNNNVTVCAPTGIPFVITGNANQIFTVGANNITVLLQNITLQNSTVGAIVNNASTGVSLTLNKVTVSGNSGTLGAVNFSPPGTLTVHGGSFTANSRTGGGGGAISASVPSIVIDQNATFAGNSATQGGAISMGGCGSCTLSIANATFTSNSATSGDGGALSLQSLGSFTISNSTFGGVGVGNSAAGNGGAISVNGTSSASSITQSTIANNLAAFGGGLYNVNGTVTVSGSFIGSNQATSAGGGFYFSTGTATVLNSTIASNHAANGGGVAQGSLSAATTIDFVTLASNQATSAGGNIYVPSSFGIVVQHSILAGGTAPTGPDMSYSSYSSGTNYNAITVPAGISATPTGPDYVGGFGLGAFGLNGGTTKNYLTPAVISSTIPYAQCASAGGVDQRGVSRPNFTNCSPGADL